MDLSAYRNVVDFKNICRTCLNNQHLRQKIHEGIVCSDNKSISILELLNFIYEVKLHKNFPDEICSICLDQLCAFYKFKLQIEKSESVLQKHLGGAAAERKTNYNEIIADDDDDIVDGTTCNVVFAAKNRVEFSSNELKSVANEADIDLGSLKVQNNLTSRNANKLLPNPLNEHENENIQTIKDDATAINNVDDDLINNISPPVICTTCNKTFKSKYILNVHLKRHKFKGQYLCPTCGKGFSSQGCLNRHMRVHTGEKKYQCEICHKRFPSSNNLNIHSRTHTGIKPYLCNLCGKSFTNRTGLNFHVKNHNKERPFACDVCNKSFGAKNHLLWHKMIHTGERPFPCSQCDKAFIKKCDLQRHESTHTDEKPFKCTICTKTFSTKVQLKYHVMIHNNDRPHKCSVCLKSFIRSYYLRNHMFKHHSNNDAAGDTGSIAVIENKI